MGAFGLRGNCSNCHALPAPDKKLRYCGRCESIHYCGKECATAHWAVHKLGCAKLRQARDTKLASHQAHGGRKEDYNQEIRDLDSIMFSGGVGLQSEIMLSAWKHRRDNPIILVSVAKSGDGNYSIPEVSVIPRRKWNVDPKQTEANKQDLRRIFGESSFHPDKQYVYIVSMRDQRGAGIAANIRVDSFVTTRIRGDEIVASLTAGTRAEDLAAAFTWLQNWFPSDLASRILGLILRSRAPMVQGGIPSPTPAQNTEAALWIYHALNLDFAIRLTGLVGAAHLNGKEGVLCVEHQDDPERRKVRLNDGTVISVKAANYVHIRRGDYTRYKK